MLTKRFGIRPYLNPLILLRHALFTLVNWLRGKQKIDYVLFTLPADMPALPEPRGWLRRRILGEPPLSLADLEREFRRIAEDPRPRGVILYLRGFNLSLADLQSLRASIARLSERGRHVICFAQGYDTATYYVASAADQIIIQPGGELYTLGLRQEAVFLRDALAAIGIEFEKIAVSPYKTAFDQLTRETISPEAREMLEWLLDSRYEMIVEGIAAGRGLHPNAVRAMIDGAPHTDQDAQRAGYIDAVLNEEELPGYLHAQHILPWPQADKILRIPWRGPISRYVALLTIEGMIVPGHSAKPPGKLPVPILSEGRAGDQTVVQQIRHVMKDPRAAAVILFVDSPGGVAAAAEAMTSALGELAKSRPLVVYMNAVAGSGGYYVATPGRWIVAQPGTTTGSIGVVTMTASSRGLFDHLRIHRLEFARGANASLLSDLEPLTEAQREQIRRSVDHNYDLFVRRVAEGRRMGPEAGDAVAGGRVWTGKQALENGLVDQLGDLQTALTKARELAELPDDAPLVMLPGKAEPLPPVLAEQVNPAAALRYLHAGLRQIGQGRALALMPFILE
jgi:protease IV